MRTSIVVLCLILVAAPSFAGREEAGYRADGTSPIGSEGSCGTFQIHSDGVYENGYAWSNDGVAAPNYGAFAECYNVSTHPICSIVLDLTQVGYQSGQTLDAYIWDSYAGAPGTVLTLVAGVNPGPIAFWPSISRHTIATGIDNCPVGDVWAGFWGDWPGASPGWFVAADIAGFGGLCPFTNVAPGIGYPTGWQDVSIIWGQTQALGIGIEVDEFTECDVFPGACCLPDGSCYLEDDPYDCRAQGGEFFDADCEPDPCGPVPVEESSWGRIKSYYSN